MQETNPTAGAPTENHDATCSSEKRGAGRNAGRGAKAAHKGRQDVFLFPRADAAIAPPVRMLCCVDDTDDFSGTTSTGFVSELLTRVVSQLGGQVVSGITRHQLLLSDQVEYTSHNSSMCFEACMPAGSVEAFREKAVQAIANEAVAEADPGLCVAVLPAESGCAQAQAAIEALHDFGIAAQTRVCTKEQAYRLADSIAWVSLSEHGGSGLGVIGAIAGIGLRLGGNDGRFRGKWNLLAAYEIGCPAQPSAPEEPARRTDDAAFADIGSFVARAAELTGGPVSVVDAEGNELPAHMPILLAKAAKPVMRAGCLTFVCDTTEGYAAPFEKVDLGALGSGGLTAGYCERYRRDTDAEECAPFEPGADAEASQAFSCRTCLFRRFTEHGFACVAK